MKTALISCGHCIVGNFRGRNFHKMVIFNLSWIVRFCHAKERHAPNFMEKTLATSHKTAKFTKGFSHESFPLYGIQTVVQVGFTTQHTIRSHYRTCSTCVDTYTQVTICIPYTTSYMHNTVQERIRTGDLSKSVYLQQKPVLREKLMNCTKNRTLVTFALSNINKMADFYAVFAVCVTTFSTGGEIPPGFKLHALTQVAHSYAHLLAITQLHAHPHHEFWHVHTRNTKKPRLYQTLLDSTCIYTCVK